MPGPRLRFLATMVGLGFLLSACVWLLVLQVRHLRPGESALPTMGMVLGLVAVAWILVAAADCQAARLALPGQYQGTRILALLGYAALLAGLAALLDALRQRIRILAWPLDVSAHAALLYVPAFLVQGQGLRDALQGSVQEARARVVRSLGIEVAFRAVRWLAVAAVLAAMAWAASQDVGWGLLASALLGPVVLVVRGLRAGYAARQLAFAQPSQPLDVQPLAARQ